MTDRSSTADPRRAGGHRAPRRGPSRPRRGSALARRRCRVRRGRSPPTPARGAVAERIANPDVTGAPRPVEPLFGFDHWITLHQIGTVVMMVTLVDGVRDRLAPPPAATRSC